METSERVILLVEDNPGDVRLMLEALKDTHIHSKTEIAGDGEEALDFLLKQKDHAAAPTPDIILLDLNIPKLSGHDVLQRIKQHERLKKIPVVILTSSSSDVDILSSYENHANAYLQKPGTLDGYSEVVSNIEGFWLTLAKLPGRIC